jgi:hypothetical protein
MADVFVRNFDDEAYRQAKMLAVKMDMTVGRVLAEGVRLFARAKIARKPGLAAVKPADLGPGTEKLSMSVDEILYGRRK